MPSASAALPPRLIALTGGPGAGKTAVLEVVRRALCDRVVVLPEAATIVFGGGFPRGTTPIARRAGQRAIFSVQRELERMALEEHRDAVVLCDRGTPDGEAYWPDAPTSYWEAVGTTRAEELARYAAVLHLHPPTVDGGFEHSNPVRIETAAEAARIDAAIAMAWDGHPRRRFVAAEADFLAKVGRAVAWIREEVAACARAPGLARRVPAASALVGALALLALGACAAAPPPPARSAADHERAAADEERAAAAHLATPHAPPGTRDDARMRCLDRAPADAAGTSAPLPRPCWSAEVDPAEADAREAREHRARAARHRAEAIALRDAERAACAGIGEDERGHSPFFHRRDVLRVDPLLAADGAPAGARIWFRRVVGLDAAALRRAVACHQARAAAMGFAPDFQPYCPLAVGPTEVEIGRTPIGLIVDVTSRDPARAAEIRRRALALPPPPPEDLAR
jgi:predicted ATPase